MTAIKSRHTHDDDGIDASDDGDVTVDEATEKSLRENILHHLQEAGFKAGDGF